MNFAKELENLLDLYDDILELQAEKLTTWGYMKTSLLESEPLTVDLEGVF